MLSEKTMQEALDNLGSYTYHMIDALAEVAHVQAREGNIHGVYHTMKEYNRLEGAMRTIQRANSPR